MTEFALLKDCIRGDVRAWEAMISRYSGALAAAASAALMRARGRADPVDVQDVCQAVLASLWADNRRRLRSYRGNASFSTWLAVIAARTALNHVRTECRKEGKRFAGLQPANPVIPPEIREHLHRLPPRQRAALSLKFYEGMKTAEIADVMGLKPVSVSSLLARGGRELARMLSRSLACL
ncbi:MAG TPA: sigma-70 family RNA polymerase sigma factor [Planctomycetota bacterium]|nr:sigma-70 family RNA polymerase sigma factor [Planctomycetota bacterium]